MSAKFYIQILISITIIGILVSVYYKYFDTKENIVDDISLVEEGLKKETEILKRKISELELKNNNLIDDIKTTQSQLKGMVNSDATLNNLNKRELELNSIETINEESINDNKEKKSNIDEVSSEKIKETTEEKIKNYVKNVEYTSIDQKGNKFYLLATSGVSNKIDNNILDLNNVRGKITSDKRDTIFIVSDFAQYNTSNLNSKFYENVIINYQDKQINCINFDINMETNTAIAYNNVVITDPLSIMRAGVVEFDLETKNININPQNENPKDLDKKIKIITN
tara:strand:+ start:1526 stop:2371 length:846 start_codon:yes stop_codon:yes gene_type:complete